MFPLITNIDTRIRNFFLSYDLFSLLKSISAFVGYLIPKLSSLKNSCSSTIAGGDKRIFTFLNGISLKVNITAQLEFELAYFEAAVQHFSPYTTGLLVCSGLVWFGFMAYQHL